MITQNRLIHNWIYFFEKCSIVAAFPLRERSKSASKTATLSATNKQLCCMFARCQFRPVSARKTRLTPPGEDKRPSRGSGTRQGKLLAHSKGDRRDFKLYFPASSRRDDDGPSFKAQPNLHAKIRRQQEQHKSRLCSHSIG